MFCCNFVYDRKTCSPECLKKRQIQSMSDRLKVAENRRNYGRGKPSYMEKSFSKWLDDFSIQYEQETKFYDTNLKKSYFVDFLFEPLKFIIELDGTQHRNYVEQDRIRDEFISSLGYEILRISHKDYQNRTFEEYIKARLTST